MHQSKIRQGQLLGKLSSLSESAKPTEVDFCFPDVLTGKAKEKPDMPYIVDLPEEVAVPQASKPRKKRAKTEEQRDLAELIVPWIRVIDRKTDGWCYLLLPIHSAPHKLRKH